MAKTVSAGQSAPRNEGPDGHPTLLRSPVVIGGIGGSGTRLVAEILEAVGYFLGSDLNAARDNLWFTLLFKRPVILSCPEDEFHRLVELFLKAMAGGAGFTVDDRAMVSRLATVPRDQHPVSWLKERATSLTSQEERPSRQDQAWGWKEPNTHVVLDRLDRAIGGMKYVFVSRHGFDMALSSNQNQARLWGPLFLGEPYEATPRYSLRYWCVAHRRVLSIAGTMGDRFLFVKYDDVCKDPIAAVARIAGFIGLNGADMLQRLTGFVRPSASIGRHKSLGLEAFDKDDIAYVESLGFAFGDR